MLATLVLLMAATGEARYFSQPESEIDPEIFRIDDKKHMGERLDPELELVDDKGQVFKVKELYGKPIILVFSYYRCDGTCSTINQVLKEILKETDLAIGKDYRVLTLSFDADDDQTTLDYFKNELDLPEAWQEGWTLALFKQSDQIQPVTARFGYKFFWSAQDQTFFHPNVYLFLSPDGRVTRYLFALTNTNFDMKLALLEAKQGNFRPAQLIQFAVSLCYSYNFEEGRYTLNIPLIVGAGSFLIGVGLLIFALLIYRPGGLRSRKRTGTS